MAYRIRKHCFTEGLYVLLILNICIEFCVAVPPTIPSPLPTLKQSSSIQQQQSTQSYHPFSTLKIPSTIATVPILPTSLTPKIVNTKNAINKMTMRESIVIPSSNSEREAQEIYDKALKQYDTLGATTRKMCSTWEQHGCQCSGTVDELTLSCRAIGLNDIPNDLPKDLIKL